MSAWVNRCNRFNRFNSYKRTRRHNVMNVWRCVYLWLNYLTSYRRSFIKRQTGGTSSDNQWQRVTTNYNEWYNKWQRVVQRVTTNDNEWQWTTTTDNEWQRVVQRMKANESNLCFRMKQYVMYNYNIFSNVFLKI